MPSQYVPFKGTQAALSNQASTGEAGVLAYTTDTQELYADSGSGTGIPAAWKLIGGADNVGVTQILAGIGVTISPTGGTGAVTVNVTPTTSLPASALTGTALASNVVSSSLTTLAGGSVGSAAYTSSATYDVSGAAATAQSNAATFATSAVATETSRAMIAEALKAPLASPTFTGIATSPEFTDGYNVYTLAQINRTAGAVELQYPGGTGNNVRMFGSTTHPIVFNGVDGSISISQSGTIVNGSIAGSAGLGMPMQGGSYKVVMIYLSGLQGTASFTFPVAFGGLPAIAGTNQVAASVVTSLSTTGVTVTGAPTTGFLMLIGY